MAQTGLCVEDCFCSCGPVLETEPVTHNTLVRLTPMMDQKWFEMPDVRKRKLNSAVWIPFRASQKLVASGHRGHCGFREEYFGGLKGGLKGTDAFFRRISKMRPL